MLSFSTLGCPDWTLDEILSIASDLKFSGVEIRGLQKEINAELIPEFSKEQADLTKEKFSKFGIKIPIISSGAVLGVFDFSDIGMKEAKEHINVAQRMGVPFVRVLCERGANHSQDVDLNLLKGNYKELLSFAAKKEVSVLLETNGIFSNTTIMKEFFEDFDEPNCGIVYDIHHPFRFNDEQPAQTIENIGKWVKHVHIKDSVVKEGKIIYKMCGEGDLPIEECVCGLKEIGFDGFFSLEWTKRWDKNLEAAGIVFPQYQSFMKKMFNE